MEKKKIILFECRLSQTSDILPHTSPNIINFWWKDYSNVSQVTNYVKVHISSMFRLQSFEFFQLLWFSFCFSDEIFMRENWFEFGIQSIRNFDTINHRKLSHIFINVKLKTHISFEKEKWEKRMKIIRSDDSIMLKNRWKWWTFSLPRLTKKKIFV